MKSTLFIGGPGTGKTHRLLQSAVAQASDGIQTIYFAYNPILVDKAKKSVHSLVGHIPEALQIQTLPQFSYSLITQHHATLGYASPPESCTAKEGRNMREEAIREVGGRMFHTEAGYNDEVTRIYREILRRENKIGYHDLAQELRWNLELSSLSASLCVYQALFVDDAQDLFIEEWAFLRAWQQEHNPLLVLAGDVNSSIAGARGSRPQEMAALVRKVKQPYQVGKSQRNKPWICTFANQLIDYNTLKAHEGLVSSLPSRLTSQLYYISVTTEQHQQNHVARQVAECLHVAEDVTVGVGVRTPEEADSYSKILTEYGVPHQVLRMRNRIEEQTLQDTRVWLGTAQEFKGLNVTAMLLPSCIDGIWPYPREHDIEECRRQFYVLVTRAEVVCYFITPQTGTNSLPTKPSPFLREGNGPEITVHGLPL